MTISLKRNVFSLTLLAVFIAAFPVAAQYAGIPGDTPPIPDSYQLDVSITQPSSSAFIIPGITAEEAERMENPDEDEIIYRRHGVTIARIGFENQYDFAYLFTGEWGLNYEKFDNAVCISHVSPSGKCFAVGGDGTGAGRGSVYVIDLETGVKYCTTPSSVWGCSDWIEGDYLLIESVGRSDSIIDMWRNDDIGNMPWINYSYLTEAEGCSNNFVLYHGGSCWMILPEDMYYNYSSRGIPGLYENGIFFDVVASPNVIPYLAGIDSVRSSFSEWIDSAGGYDDAFPIFDFRVYVDTRTNSVSDIRQMTPGMVVEGYLSAMKAGNFNRMQQYLTQSEWSSITDEQREEIENVLWLFSGIEYRICEVSEDGDHASVTSEYSFLGQSEEIRFILVKEQNRWLINAMNIYDLNEFSRTVQEPQ
jgi:hypothetical protein